MATLTKNMLDFCITAYRCLKDEEGERPCFIKYRENNSHYIDFVMQKNSWNFGKWTLFEGSIYVMNIDESVLQEWSDNELKSKLPNENNCSNNR